MSDTAERKKLIQISAIPVKSERKKAMEYNLNSRLREPEFDAAR